jgi:hypothetical protein
MKGILYTPENIKLVAKGLKSVTRRLDGLKEINKIPRVIKLMGVCPCDLTCFRFRNTYNGDIKHIKPRYHTGETVYVKEAWDSDCTCGSPQCNGVIYKLGYSGVITPDRWRSPLFMPDHFARTFLQITDVRPERLKDITVEDCIAEGCVSYLREHDACVELKQKYFTLWDSINPQYPASLNPWVWRIESKLVNRPESL